MQAGSLWSGVKAELEISLSPGTFATWISPLEISKLKKSKAGKYLAKLACPSVFHKNQDLLNVPL